MSAACAGVSDGEVNRASQHVQECLYHWKMVQDVGECRSYHAREVANQSEAAKRARDTVERQSRALRRGGAPGDVVPLGKRMR